MIQEIHEGDIGTIFEVTVKDDGVVVDISAATTKRIILSNPSGEATSYAGAFKTDGTDGIVQYTSTADILTPPGIWQLQAHVAFSSSQDWKSDIHEFKVYENL